MDRQLKAWRAEIANANLFWKGKAMEKCENCKKCFLTPDMCGADDDKQKCEQIYENKWILCLEIFTEFVKSAVPIVFWLIFLILGLISWHWHIETRTPLF